MDWCHVTFASASGAMAAQHALRGICPVVVMPVLRQVSAGCGIALRVEPEQVEQVRQILREKAVGEWDMYAVTGSGRALRCERL
ncbi:MAG: DUF3343 domain-containing protein [Clostridiales bacterium]|nr:DUF3343 domain-containing protein [Clostridiales bacterium]